jgi:beta-galactosidase
MIDLRDKTIRIDGHPRMLISGEVHYYRLPRYQWRDRLEKLKEAGCNTVASYIPWLCHEPEKGHFDLDGHTRPELALAEFIDLCQELELFFIARPGPFIMAEMKNEGVPYYLYEDHPEIVPVGWDDKKAPTRTLDYSAPAFLSEIRRWYDAVIPILADRLHDKGGNVIAVQLDNEVGMLSWVSNTPDLTDTVIADFWNWLDSRYGEEGRASRYPFDGNAIAASIRSPQEAWAGPLMQDLASYMRYRFANYFSALREMVEANGITGVPFIINIHGTEAGGGASYPIGISQLYEAFTQDAGYISGSDHYLGNLTAQNGPDWFVMNAYMDAVNLPDQPLTSMEFEAGEGDYGGSMGARLDPSAAPFKLRMAAAQGNRLVNYYLFTGGYNYRMDRETGDGNDRISFTGERHGVGAPVNPEGVRSYTFPALARANKTLLALEDVVATANEERDNVAMAFIPDYYATESVYQKSDTMKVIAENLRRSRFGGPGTWLARALFQATVRYTAIDIQNRDLSPEATPVLVLGSARYMSRAIQERLLGYVRGGGQLLLMGEVPLFDMEGNECRVLHDALGLEHVGERNSTHRYFLSLTADGWAAPREEWRATWAQTFRTHVSNGEVLFHVYGEEESAGFDIPLGDGRVIAITAEIPLQMPFVESLLEQLGVNRGLRHTSHAHNIFLGSARTPDGARLIHALNFDGFDKTVKILLEGEELFEGREVMLRRRDGVMLPIGVDLGDVRIEWSTAEVARRDESSLTFRLTGPRDAVMLTTSMPVAPSDAYTVYQQGDSVLIESAIEGHGEEEMTIRFG